MTKFVERWLRRKKGKERNIASHPATPLPAVLLIDQEFPKHGNKNGEDPLNITSFVAKDKNYGYERKDRPEILFTLFEPSTRPNVKPTGYLMDEERVCLDPHLHGIRDFEELPKIISAAVDGQDIEYWIRQNAQISRYDIMGEYQHLVESA